LPCESRESPSALSKNPGLNSLGFFLTGQMPGPSEHNVKAAIVELASEPIIQGIQGYKFTV